MCSTMGESGYGEKLRKWTGGIFGLFCCQMEKPYTTHFLIGDISHEG